MKDTKFFYSLFKALLKEPRQAMLFSLGIFLLIFGLVASTPRPSELELFSGELKSAVAMQDCWGKCRTEVVITIGPTYRRFWNDAVKKSNYKQLGESGSIVAIYIEKNRSTPLSRIGNAEKSWGLIVNGNEIQSLNKALLEERFWLHIALPFIGIILIALTFPYSVFRPKKP